jgi:hypothetical protein
MSWGAQNRSKDAKTPSVGLAMSRKPKLELCGIQPYSSENKIHLFLTFPELQSFSVVLSIMYCPVNTLRNKFGTSCPHNITFAGYVRQIATTPTRSAWSPVTNPFSSSIAYINTFFSYSWPCLGPALSCRLAQP